MLASATGAVATITFIIDGGGATITTGINDMVKMLSNIPGFGGLANMQIGQIDASGIEQNLGNAVASAMDRVEAARSAADAKAAEQKTGGSGFDEMMGGAGGGGAGRASVSRMFSTSMGLFVKDPLLAETRRSNTILDRIDKGIQNLRPMTPGSTMPGTGMRFT
jgi:hypothetical protein